VARASSGRLSKQDYIDAILAGNLFDSTQVGAPATAAAEPVDGEGRPTDLKAVLLGTIVAEPTEFSSALIAQEKGQSGIGYGIDDNLFGEGTVVRIEAKKVFIRRNDGAVEYMSMGDEKEVPEKPGRSAGGEDKAGAEGVEKAGDNKYVIEQSVIDKIIENPEKLYSQARANPHKDAAGNVDGYRLSGIRSKSFFGQLGLKNGDVLHSVNGKTITSMSSAMDAYNSMANEKNFNVEITRRNKRQTMEYEVR
jgi:type II secretion system protein C